LSREVLLVVDSLEFDWAQTVINNKDDSTRYHLFTIGFSPEQAFLQYQKHNDSILKKVKIVDTVEISRVAENKAREYYLEMIKEFPEKKFEPKISILDTLSYKKRNLWWFLPVCEKSIWLDQLIHRVYALLRFIYTWKQAEYDEVVFYMDDSLLNSVFVDFAIAKNIDYNTGGEDFKSPKPNPGLTFFTISYYRILFGEIYKILAKLIILRPYSIKADNVKSDAVGFFSIYPLWWKTNATMNPTDIFFQEIPDEIAKTETVQHLVWLEPWKELLNNKELIKFLQNRNVIVLEKLIKVIDILSVLSPVILIKAVKIASQIKRHKLASVNDVDISGFVRESIIQSFLSQTFFRNFLLDKAFARVKTENLKCLIFRLEFQPVERAILYNTAGRTKTFGFQHSAMSKNFLNYVFTGDEFVRHLTNRGAQNSLPLPDNIFTSGELAFNYIKQAGFPVENLAVCGGVRFNRLFEYSKKRLSKNELRLKHNLPLDKKIIFIPTSQIINETVCMFNDLAGSLKDNSELFHIIVKGNPNKDNDPAFLAEIISILENSEVKISFEVFKENIPFYDYISLSDAVLLTGGSTAVEAMALDVISIIYVCPPQFSHNPMVEYPDAVLLVHDRKSMENAIKTINDENIIDNMKKHWNVPVRNMFGDVEDPNKRFLELFREKIQMN